MPIDNRQPPHILLVAFPIQSHLNPAIEFAARLLRSGALVTLVTTVAGSKRMNKSDGAVPVGLSFATISDGYDDGFTDDKKPDSDAYVSSLKSHGSETLSGLIAAGPRYTCVVYTIMLSWVAPVARHHNTPSAVLWIQNAALLSIYYHYFNGYSDEIDKCDENDPDWTVAIPSLPPLHARDIPSFLRPSNLYKFAGEGLKLQFEELKKDDNPIVLINSFDSLEHGIIESMSQFFKVLAVGPLLSVSDKTTSFKVDMFKQSEDDCVAWLDTKPDKSVVYVSFGSISVLSKAQLEELAEALIYTGRPFLWVIRPKEDKEDEKISRWEELQERGMVVPWCSQVEVLSHRAVGCFVTHCGWNSMLESLAMGVPMVGVPQWTDQPMNAKMAESMWGTGVRVEGTAAAESVWGTRVRVEGTVAEEKVVGREEIRRCVEEVMESEEMERNARRWHDRAMEAAKEGGSSEVNLWEFLEEVSAISRTRFDANHEEI